MDPYVFKKHLNAFSRAFDQSFPNPITRPSPKHKSNYVVSYQRFSIMMFENIYILISENFKYKRVSRIGLHDHPT